MKNDKRPHWLPRGSLFSASLTEEQINYIRPVFNVNKNTIDGVSLCGNIATGTSIALKLFARRFEYSDIEISNITAT